MKTNKQKWNERHAQGKTKMDVAIETQLQADAAFIFNSVKKAQSKMKGIKVNAVAEAAEDAAVKTDKTTAKKKAEADKQSEVNAAGDKALNEKATKVVL